MNATDFDADVIIIGSGPAGVSAAFPLVEAGTRVLMMDGAGGDGVAGDDEISPWKKMLGRELQALLPEDGLSPKLRAPTSRRIVGEFQRAGYVRGDGFVAIGAHARGGLSQIWGGFVCEFGAEDLAPWPCSVDHLRPSYAAVTERIGVSGSATDELSDFYGKSGPILPPLPLGPTAARLFGRYVPGRCGPGFAVGAARNAILTADRPGRKACNLSRDCLWGCRRGAVYDARFDLAALARHRTFRLVDEALAVSVTARPGGWDIITGDGRRFCSPRIILAAGTLGTSALVLPLLPNPPRVLRLLSSPVIAMPLLVPGRLGRAMPKEGYSLAQLGYRLCTGNSSADYVTGAVYELAFLPVASFANRLPFSYPAGMELLSAVAFALLVATGYFRGDYSNNTLEWSQRDGRSLVVVRGGFDVSLPNKVAEVTRRLRRIWRQLGAWMLPGTSLAPPGTDVHFGGPFAMGLGFAHGTTAYGELHAAPGVFVADGAAFPSLPSKYPTLTIMANADRIGRHVAARR